MKYISTRGEAQAIGFLDAVLVGLAPDGGLFVPQEWPTFTPAEIAAFARRLARDIGGHQVATVGALTLAATRRTRATSSASRRGSTARAPMRAVARMSPSSCVRRLAGRRLEPVPQTSAQSGDVWLSGGGAGTGVGVPPVMTHCHTTTSPERSDRHAAMS